jgi:hypothetical protein
MWISTTSQYDVKELAHEADGGVPTPMLQKKAKKRNCKDNREEKKMKKYFVVLILFLGVLSAVTALAASDRFAFVTSEGDNNLAVIDLNTGKIVKTLPTGKTPHALAFTKDGKGYVNNRGSKELTVIDGNKFEVIRTIALRHRAGCPVARRQDLRLFIKMRQRFRSMTRRPTQIRPSLSGRCVLRRGDASMLVNETYLQRMTSITAS